MPNGYEIAVFYCPLYHPDKRNDKWHGKGWTEWELVKRAEPRFPGHKQPCIPLWGYEDESETKVHEKKLQAAIDHGIDVMLYDWYWYDDGPYIDRCLNNGFLKAKNNKEIKFALMWAPHNWNLQNPFARIIDSIVLQNGAIKEKTFNTAMDFVIKNYFSHPSYWRVKGGLFFSIFDYNNPAQEWGGPKKTRIIFDKLRKKVRNSGLGEMHLNLIDIGIGGKLLDKSLSRPEALSKFAKEAGFDSITDYNWTIRVPLPKKNTEDYSVYRKQAVKEYTKLAKEMKIPFFTHVTMGWDVSSRCVQSDVYENLNRYPYLAILKNNTPSEFKKALLDFKKIADMSSGYPKIITINSFNEWTEGSYLEPDTVNKFKYLEAIKTVFK